MGIRNWFRKDEVVGSRILVCSLDDKFEELMSVDAGVYERHYAFTSTAKYRSIPDLGNALGHRPDVLHLFCNVLPSGMIDAAGTTISGTELIEKCCDAGLKLLWIASDNPPDGYIKNFRARGKKLNLVMTISRKGEKFTDFLDGLLAQMSQGTTMPTAWVNLVPQRPKTASDAPECIFFAGRGGVLLR